MTNIQSDAGATHQGVQDTLAVGKKQLEQLQRIASVGAVASSVAHEFNNLLTTILNHAKIGMQSNDPESKDRSFDRILNAARRAATITTGMLALSRNRSDRKQVSDIVALVEEVLVVVEKDLIKSRIRIERQYQLQPQLEVVPCQIEQVLMNLLINARQAMPNGGIVQVGVRLDESGRMVEISVRDTGVGIPPEQLSRIFEPFFTTKEGPDDAGQGGSGLGLSICREIVERHRGRIRVESIPQRGSTFTVKLPMSPANGNPVSPSHQAA